MLLNNSLEIIGVLIIGHIGFDRRLDLSLQHGVPIKIRKPLVFLDVLCPTLRRGTHSIRVACQIGRYQTKRQERKERHKKQLVSSLGRALTHLEIP